MPGKKLGVIKCMPVFMTNVAWYVLIWVGPRMSNSKMSNARMSNISVHVPRMSNALIN